METNTEVESEKNNKNTKNRYNYTHLLFALYIVSISTSVKLSLKLNYASFRASVWVSGASDPWILNFFTCWAREGTLVYTGQKAGNAPEPVRKLCWSWREKSCPTGHQTLSYEYSSSLPCLQCPYNHHFWSADYLQIYSHGVRGTNIS